MITVITGTPGAGKTLYTIAKLLQPLVGTTVTAKDENGDQVQIPRTIYTNINGLQLDHQLIGPGGTWDQSKSKDWTFEPIPGTDGQGLRDWHTWAKPGSVIIYDEFQKVWPPRPNGAPVPPDLQALDTHRHMGVDLILISQTPNNFDRHIAGLTGRHLHVRRFGNMGLTIVYEWDHLSRTLMYSKAIAKNPWKYDKKVFQLYKSAELHTKQPRKLPAHLFIVGIALAAAAYLIPTVIDRISSAADPQKLATEATSEATKALGLPTPTQPLTGSENGLQPAVWDYAQFVPRVPTMPESAPAYDELRQVVNMPRVAGGICSSSECKCYTQQGTNAGLTSDDCRAWLNDKPFDPYHQPQPDQPASNKLQDIAQPPSGTERLHPNHVTSAASITSLDLKF